MSLLNKLRKPMVGNFISLVLLQGVNYLLPFISFPFLFHVLGVERWGLISFGYTFTQYLVTFTDFGFNLSATKYISQNQNDTQKVNSYLNSAMIGRFFLAGISFLILTILILTVGKFETDAKFYLFYFGIVLGNVMFPLWFFQGMEKMKYITIFNLAAKSLSFIPMFIFIKNPSHYIYVPICYSAGYLFAGIISIYIIYFKMGLKWFIPTFNQIKSVLTDSSAYFLSRVSISLFASSNTFILGLVCGNTITGYYAAAEKLYQAYNQLASPLSGVLFPHISKTRDVAFFKKIFKRVVIANFLFIGFAILFSDTIAGLIFEPNQYIINVLRIILVGSLFSIPSMLIGYPFIAAMGHPNYTNWTVVLTSCFHLSCLAVLLLFNSINIYSVSILLVCTEMLLASLRFYGAKKYKLWQV